MTAEAEERSDEKRPDFYGRVIIEWPAPRSGVLAGWGVAIRDAATGEPITTAMSIKIGADAEHEITAELTQILGTDGQPARQGPPDPVTGRVPDIALDIGEDGEPKTAVFRYIVAEMRVAGHKTLDELKRDLLAEHANNYLPGH